MFCVDLNSYRQRQRHQEVRTSTWPFDLRPGSRERAPAALRAMEKCREVSAAVLALLLLAASGAAAEHPVQASSLVTGAAERCWRALMQQLLHGVHPRGAEAVVRTCRRRTIRMEPWPLALAQILLLCCCRMMRTRLTGNAWRSVQQTRRQQLARWQRSSHTTTTCIISTSRHPRSRQTVDRMQPRSRGTRQSSSRGSSSSSRPRPPTTPLKRYSLRSERQLLAPQPRRLLLRRGGSAGWRWNASWS